MKHSYYSSSRSNTQDTTVLRYFLATNFYCHFVLAIIDAHCKMAKLSHI